ncbi:MAG: hypothetical protein ABS76_16295 [Pelagibacterium sp. SCN 64-44]|nr:MAG: hypothetical protein ABS76_16295 [Pelagibacterium sp. SCN 64-44]
MTDASYNNDNDDNETLDEGTGRDATDLLAGAALSAALTRKLRAQLKRHPSVIILSVPNAEWVPVLCQAIRRMEDAPVVRGVSEGGKSGASKQRIGKDELRWLQSGKSVLFVSQDPGALLHDAVLAGCDVTVTVPALTPALLRQVIRQLTGGIARGVTKEMAELDLVLLVSLLRPGSTAKQCVANLRRAVGRGGAANVSKAPPGPLLEALPLTENVREWADQSAADLRAAIAGQLPSEQMVYAVLEGPAGTGKTLIGESLARSTGSAFVYSSVGEWFTTGDGALGGVARNLRLFIETLLNQAPSVGLLDEIESVPNRATMDNRGRDWWNPVVTLFLTEIDRLRKSGRPILLLGATNYYSRLDAALIRPGRLHQRVSVLPPSTDAELRALLRYYLRTDMDEADIARLLPLVQGATPAEIEGAVKQARRAARAKKRPLQPADLVEQIVPLDERSAEDVRSVAIHELGHAVVAYGLGLDVTSVSIIPQGLSSGHMLVRRPSLLPTWDHVTKLVTVALGGRAADIVVGTGAHAGAEADLAEATRLLLAAHEIQGLRDDLVSRHVLGSPIMRDELHRRISVELDQCLDQAIGIVEGNRNTIIMLAERLMEEKVLSGAQLAAAITVGNAAAQRSAAGKDQRGLQKHRQAESLPVDGSTEQEVNNDVLA